MNQHEYWERELGLARSFGTADVARICNVKQRTAQRWIASGRLFALTSSETGRFDARIPRQALLDFLVRRTPLAAYPLHVEV